MNRVANVFAVKSKYKVNTLYSRTNVGECKLYDPLFLLSSLNEFYEWTEQIPYYIFICVAALWRTSSSLFSSSYRRNNIRPAKTKKKNNYQKLK